MYNEEKKKRVNFGMEKDLHKKATEKAKEEGRSLSNFISHCVAEYLRLHK